MLATDVTETLDLARVRTGATTLAGSILTPVHALERGAAHVASGDLDYRVPPADPPELHRLAGTFNHMAESLRKKERALADLSVRDPLTNVFNRRELLGRLELEIERSRRYGDPVVLLFLDADGFKSGNDTDGHQVGDAVLSRFATLIARAVRPTDVVRRYGGDEFAVVIRELLAVEWTAEAPRWLPRVTTSVGLAEFPADAAAQDGLIHAADRAVYEAKAAGGNAVRVAADLFRDVIQRTPRSIRAPARD